MHIQTNYYMWQYANISGEIQWCQYSRKYNIGARHWRTAPIPNVSNQLWAQYIVAKGSV